MTESDAPRPSSSSAMSAADARLRAAIEHARDQRRRAFGAVGVVVGAGSHADENRHGRRRRVSLASTTMPLAACDEGQAPSAAVAAVHSIDLESRHSGSNQPMVRLSGVRYRRAAALTWSSVTVASRGISSW